MSVADTTRNAAPTQPDVSPDRMADAIRFLALDAIAKAEEGHPGAPLGCAEIATALFTRHLRCNPQDPHWPDRDRFVLSNGHGSMLISACWAPTRTATRNTRPATASR